MHVPNQYKAYCCLQAPANIYYIPNFISEEEAAFLWKQVDMRVDGDAHIHTYSMNWLY